MDRTAMWDICNANAHLVHALAQGYMELYYVNLETGEYSEYHTKDDKEILTEARHGSDFFGDCEKESEQYIHAEDREAFMKAMNPDFLMKELTGNKVFTLTYRRIWGEWTFYVELKASRSQSDSRVLIITVSDIDELVRKRQESERAEEERRIYARLHALTGNYIAVYVVDPETENYHEFSATADYTASFAQAKTGTNFFATARTEALNFNHPDDLNRFLSAFTKQNVMNVIQQKGMFTLDYRILMGRQALYVQMKAAMVEEPEGPRLIIGLCDNDDQYRQKKINQEIAEQKEVYDQITASLAEQYDTLYYIDLETGTYNSVDSLLSKLLGISPRLAA